MAANRKPSRKRARVKPDKNTSAVSSGSLNTVTADTVTLAPHPISVSASRQTISYLGPIPPPAVLEGYNKVCPGSAKQLLEIYRLQVQHRLKLEDRITKGDNIRAYLGWGSSTFVSLFLISVGGFLIYQGHDAAGASIITANIVGLTTVFLYGSESRRRERIAKAKIRDAQAPAPKQADDGPAIADWQDNFDKKPLEVDRTAEDRKSRSKATLEDSFDVPGAPRQ